MKAIKSFLVLVLLISPILSCDELEELTETEIAIPISFVIDINRINGTVGSFSQTAGYDLLSNPDVANAVGTPEQIKKLVLNSVQYQYRNFSGNVDAIIQGEMVFFTSHDPEASTFITQPVNVSEASFTTEVFNAQGASGVNLLPLDGTEIIGVNYHGSQTANGTLFDTRVFVNATVTVEVNLNDL